MASFAACFAALETLAEKTRSAQVRVSPRLGQERRDKAAARSDGREPAALERRERASPAAPRRSPLFPPPSSRPERRERAGGDGPPVGAGASAVRARVGEELGAEGS